MKKLRIGIIGCGRMGAERANACRVLGSEIAVVYDSDPERAEAFGGEFGCIVVKDPLEFRMDSIDALFVCTPPSARGPMELAAIENSTPLFVEKPVGLSVEKCRTLMSIVRSRAVVTAVGYMNRYRPSVRAARDALRGQRILGASCFWFGTPYRVQWWSSLEQSGGPINEQATHLVDLARFLIGEIEEVHAMWTPDASRGETVGSAAITLKMEQGSLCSILYSCLAEKKMINFSVFVADDSIKLEGWDFHRADDAGRNLLETDKSAIFREEVAAFLRAVERGSRDGILSDFEDACKTQMAVDAILKSARRGRSEKLNGVHN